ncbi:MAG: zinc ribbon domain-containing protein [Actinomycetota bacterium]
MVKRPLLRELIPFIVVLALIVCFSAWPALAQEVGEETDYSMQEEYRVELSETGDAHITDTITYDPAWFEEYGYVFEENPNLLSRRYRADTNVGEVENFDVDIDSGDATVTVTFDTPGLAYRLSDGWTVYGYGDYELVEEGDDEIVLRAAWTVTNEYSLFEPMGLEEEVVIDLPNGAQNGDYDEAEGAIAYDLAYAEESAGVLAENKTLFTIIFAVIMALSLILLLYLFTRRGQTPVAVEAVTPAARAVEAASPEAAAGTGTKPTEKPRFCKKCGHPRSGEGERFCRKCGAEHS